AVRNNGGGHLNHSLFWKLLTPDAKEVSGEVKDAIESKFGSVDEFKEKFKAPVAARFGSGWAGLVVTNVELEIVLLLTRATLYLKVNLQSSALMSGSTLTI